jgi:hypothetical protein
MHAHLAELLLRLKRPADARAEFERSIAEAQEEPAVTVSDQVHSHSRLADLAEAAGDEYAAHLHRGIGLYVLAQERARLAQSELSISREGLLCRSAAELALAHQERPDEARPRWYLYRVWAQLDRRDVALRYLAEADSAAPFTYLTPAEGRDLQLAWHYHHDAR